MTKGIGTKAQNALKMQQEARKQEQKSISKIKKEERNQLQFEKRQEKKKGH